MLNKFIRPTVIIRSVMRNYGHKTYMMWTNTYKHCKTVKCYANGKDDVEMIVDISNALSAAGVKNFSVTKGDGQYSNSWRALQSIIVRIPNSEFI